MSAEYVENAAGDRLWCQYHDETFPVDGHCPFWHPEEGCTCDFPAAGHALRCPLYDTPNPDEAKPMSAEEARAEARGEAWASYRKDVQPNPLHFERERVAFKAGWDARDRQASREVTEARVELAARAIYEETYRPAPYTWDEVAGFTDDEGREWAAQIRSAARAALEAAREVRS